MPPISSRAVSHKDTRPKLEEKLISQLMDDCAVAGLQKVYLFTPGQESFYQSLGWTLRNREMYQVEAVAIMSYDFSRHPTTGSVNY